MMAKRETTKNIMNPKARATKRDVSQTRAALAGDATEQPIEFSNGMREQIAKKARELWEQRGHREGHDLQDWFDAEAIVTGEMHEARE